jgi:hypothetical protein
MDALRGTEADQIQGRAKTVFSATRAYQAWPKAIRLSVGKESRDERRRFWFIVASPHQRAIRASDGMSAPARGRIGFVSLRPCVKSVSARLSENHENGAVSVCKAIFAEEAFMAYSENLCWRLVSSAAKAPKTPIRIEGLSQTAFNAL